MHFVWIRETLTWHLPKMTVVNVVWWSTARCLYIYEHLPVVPTSQHLDLRAPACTCVFFTQSHQADKCTRFPRSSKDKYSSSLTSIPVLHNEKHHLVCLDLQPYKCLRTDDGFIFLMFMSPTTPIPALILLLARRGHSSLVGRETENPHSPRQNLSRHRWQKMRLTTLSGQQPNAAALYLTPEERLGSRTTIFVVDEFEQKQVKQCD